MRTIIAILVLITGVLNTSCEDIIEVPDISEESVALLAPSDGTLVEQSNVTFTWEEVFEATRYHVQVAEPSFEDAAQIVVDTLIVVDSTFVSPKVNKTLTDSTYEWRVRAQNTGYQTEFSVHQFTVKTIEN